jgi:hypothetical protein
MESDSPYELKTLLENAEVWRSADIRTNYELEDVTVEKSEGGSSATVCTEEDGDIELKIFVSMDRQMRECALLTDFPMQLVAALELEPTHYPDLHLILQVPLDSIKTLMIKRGFIGGGAADGNQDVPSHSTLRHIENQDEARENSRDLVRTSSAEHVAVHSTSASASSEAARRALQPSVRSRPSSRPTTPESRSHDSLIEPVDASPDREPVTPQPAIAGPFSAHNRDRNRDLLRGFMRNAGRTPGSQRTRNNSEAREPDSAFDMSILSRTLEAVQLVPVTESVQVNHGSPRRAGPIPNRNEEQRARDFEVGFLGEQFVSFHGYIPALSTTDHFRS